MNSYACGGRSWTLCRVVLLVLVVAASVAWADPPETVNIRGQLLNSEGRALPGVRDFGVQFYDAATGGSPLGGAITGQVEVTLEGLFNIPVVLPPAVLQSAEAWYEVAVASGATPGPLTGADVFPDRVKVESVPFALEAAEAAHAAASDTATHATAADMATTADTATHADTADSATHADTADAAIHADTADAATHADTADSATHADTADAATHADTADSATSAGDSDTVDGKHASAFAVSLHNHDGGDIRTGKINNARLNTGSGNGLDADLLDGWHRSAFSTITHMHDTDYWGTAGNSGTTAGTNYVGTRDNVALEFKVNSARALRVEPNATSPNIIGGYSGNLVNAGVYGGTISGGGIAGDLNAVTGNHGAIGGGGGNTVGAAASTVGGGWRNAAIADCSTVAGGNGNMANGYRSTVAGGNQNAASGSYSTVPGGLYNSAAGDFSFCAGRRAKTAASGDGTFVWADSTDADLTGNDPNMFLVRASRGVYLWTNSTCTTGVYVGAGGTGWNPISDRNKKENIQAVNPSEILEKLVAIPVSTWSLIDDDASLTYMGPMAQDFYAAFGLGNDDRSINTVNADGVALAAIQGLNQKVEEQAATIATQASEIAELKTRLERLEALVQQLAGR